MNVVFLKRSAQLLILANSATGIDTYKACIGYFGIRDIGLFFKGYWDICVLILGHWIFRNFGIWDIGNYFGIRVKLILGYWIFWTVYFGIWDIAYLPNQASLIAPETFRGIFPHRKGLLIYLPHLDFTSLCIDYLVKRCKLQS